MTKIDANKAELLAAKVASSGATIGSAGESLGWGQTDTYRLSRSPEYRQELARKTLEIADAIVAQSIAAHSAAMSVLIDIMATGVDEHRLGAAKAIIANFSKIHESANKQLIAAGSAIEHREAMNLWPFPFLSTTDSTQESEI